MADYFGRACGSALESRGHLEKAAGQKLITPDECADVGGKYTKISNMLTPWINYLQRCNWKSRGVRPDGLPDESRETRDSSGKHPGNL